MLLLGETCKLLKRCSLLVTKSSTWFLVCFGSALLILRFSWLKTLSLLFLQHISLCFSVNDFSRFRSCYVLYVRLMYIEYGKFGRIRAYEDFGYWIIWPSYACTTQEQLTIFCNENFRQTEGNLGLILLILNPCWWYFAFKLSLWRRFDFRCKVVRKWWSLCSWKFRRHIFTYCHLLLIESKPVTFSNRGLLCFSWIS